VAVVTLVHTNDLHGSLNRDKFPFLLSARQGADFYFDSGDCVKSGNLALPLGADPAWSFLAEARCDASVPGNRESHPLASGKRAKFKGLGHTVLCANWFDRRGQHVFPSHAFFDVPRGGRLAVFGVMVPMVTKGMATQAASQYTWEPPIATAVQMVAELRSKADFVVALTHIGLVQDKKLALACPELDLILGGHSHTVLEQPEMVGDVPICQGGSHGKFIGRYTLERGKGLTRAELLPWP
jgi:2',3'-cyclic-nucleotide 2'-phosphodiesterase (5'-nucleotidase family)